jgi:hypothetical protein
MEIKNETIDKVMAYLTVHPWNQVEALIHEISDQIAVAQQPKAPEPKKDTKK